MPQVNIKIQSLAEAGHPILEGDHSGLLFETQELTVGILEKDTIGGQTGITFCLHYPDRDIRIVRMTAAIFEGIYGAFVGAQRRFGQYAESFNLNTSQDCQQKLLDAGFTLYRFDANRLVINYCSKPGAWKLHSKGYTSKAALERKRKELMADPKALEG